MKRLLPLLLVLPLMGQDCEPAPVPTNFYCAGAVPEIAKEITATPGGKSEPAN